MSVRDYAQLFDLVSSGQAGTDNLLKLGSVYADMTETKEANSGVESDENARKRRLIELLQKRAPTGLASGSASPNPPKD